MPYEAKWKGFDRGREDTFAEPVWSGVLRILSIRQGEDFHDPQAALHDDLSEQFPEITWIGDDEEFRPFLRDYPQAWTLTGVLEPRTTEHPTVRLTALGKAFVAGQVSRAAVFLEAMAHHAETRLDGVEERPFQEIAAAFLQADSRTLSLEEIYNCVECGWRRGDGGFTQALLAPNAHLTVPPTPRRRLRMMLKTMTEVGALTRHDSGWSAASREILGSIEGGGGLDLASGVPTVMAQPEAAADEAELSSTATQVAAELEEAIDEETQRRRVLRSILERRGQPRFRRTLLSLYGNRCAISGYDAPQALEAAHITAFAASGMNHPQNGVLLRADLHTLFDLRLLSIDPTSMTVRISSRLAHTRYAKFEGGAVTMPASVADRPSVPSLQSHFDSLLE